MSTCNNFIHILNCALVDMRQGKCFVDVSSGWFGVSWVEREGREWGRERERKERNKYEKSYAIKMFISYASRWVVQNKSYTNFWNATKDSDMSTCLAVRELFLSDCQDISYLLALNLFISIIFPFLKGGYR